MKTLDDVILNKSAIIERCLARVAQEYQVCPDLHNYTYLDAIILNLERACQAAIDLAMHIIAQNHLDIPQGSADVFMLLAKDTWKRINKVITYLKNHPTNKTNHPHY